MNSKSFKLQKPSFFLHQATMLQQTFQFLQETQLFLGYDFWHLQLLSFFSTYTKSFFVPNIPNFPTSQFFFHKQPIPSFSHPSCNTQIGASNKHDSHFLPLSICSVHSKVVALWMGLLWDLDYNGMDLDGWMDAMWIDR